MNNQVTEIFTNTTDMELSQFVQEMKEDNPQGIIRMDGIVRDKCRMVHEIVGGGIYEHMLMVQLSLFTEAAYRFTPKFNND
jgi:hypothetical protein